MTVLTENTAMNPPLAETPLLDTQPEKIRFVQRRTNLYCFTYGVLRHPTHGMMLIPVYQTMRSRSKYMPHMGLKERVKALKNMRAWGKLPIDVLLIGDEDESKTRS